jgi:hypothetical protein
VGAVDDLSRLAFRFFPPDAINELDRKGAQQCGDRNENVR